VESKTVELIEAESGMAVSYTAEGEDYGERIQSQRRKKVGLC
jgi:hypothetical protein